MDELVQHLTKRNVLGTSTVLLVLYAIYRYRKLVAWQKKVGALCAGPPCHPLLGNFPQILEVGSFDEKLFNAFHGKYGDMIRFFLGPTSLNIAVNDPELVHEVYRKCRERPKETYLFLWFLGKENLLFQRGPIVKEMRMRYGEMISARPVLEKVHEVSVERFTAAVDSWSAGEYVDVHKELGPLIYDIMGSILFDSPWLSTEEGREIYRLHKKLIVEVNRWILWPFPPLFHPGYIDYIMSIRKWRNIMGSILDKRAKEMRANPERYLEDKSAVNMILTSTNPDGTPFFSKGRAISTMCGFLNGAYDTTHATSYWMIWHLAKNPSVQQKLLDEFDAKLGGNLNPTLDELRECDYLHAFFLESMRNRATVTCNQRVNDNEDVEIGGVIVPAGTNINLPNGTTFHDERWFGANPLEFRPERFLGDSPEAVTARKSWTAFGEYTRMCIGQTFALVELKAFIHALITRSVIELEDPNDVGEVMFEAGVNQPVTRCRFLFHKREVRRVKEEENLKWWIQQVAALDNVKPAAANAASLA